MHFYPHGFNLPQVVQNLNNYINALQFENNMKRLNPKAEPHACNNSVKLCGDNVDLEHAGNSNVNLEKKEDKVDSWKTPHKACKKETEKIEITRRNENRFEAFVDFDLEDDEWSLWDDVLVEQRSYGIEKDDGKHMPSVIYYEHEKKKKKMDKKVQFSSDACYADIDTTSADLIPNTDSDELTESKDSTNKISEEELSIDEMELLNEDHDSEMVDNSDVNDDGDELSEFSVETCNKAFRNLDLLWTHTDVFIQHAERSDEIINKIKSNLRKLKETETERFEDFEGLSKHVIQRVEYIVEKVKAFDQNMLALEYADDRNELFSKTSELMPQSIKIKNLMRVSRV